MAHDDFDFFHGTWDVRNRRLTAEGWDEFPAHCTVRKLLGNIGFIDEMVFPTLDSAGHTIGLYNSTLDSWAHYWVSTSNGVLQPPVYGLPGSPLEMQGEDTIDGKPARVRYLWTVISHDELRWEQAFAFDSETWETNWVMECTRVA